MDIDDLAMNMGGKPMQITKHYSHVTTQHKRRQITQMAPKLNKTRTDEHAVPPPPTQHAMQADAFVLEATRRFQSGELSGEALQAVLTSMKPQNT